MKWECIDGWVNEEGSGVQIAACFDDDLAEQITREHNLYPKLVEIMAESLAEKFSGIIGSWDDMNGKTKDEYRKLAVKLAEEVDIDNEIKRKD